MKLKPFNQLKPWDKFIRLTWTSGLCLLLIGMESWIGHPTSHIGDAFILIGAFLLTFPWMCTWGVRAGIGLGKEINVASRGVPDPAYIQAQLRAEWGREPTMQEVAAVHTMLTNRHNQALLNTGIGLGAIYLMNQNLHQ